LGAHFLFCGFSDWNGDESVNRPYTEAKVLKKLDIPDFRYITKDKVIALATMIPKMDSEVAKKAIEQFPNFSSTSLQIMKEYKDILEQAIRENKEGTQILYDMYNHVMGCYEQTLIEDNLTFDEKMYILDKMKEIADEMHKIENEKENARLKIVGVASGVVTTIVAVLGAAIGVNMASKSNDDKEI
jgi:hypothetical protein